MKIFFLFFEENDICFRGNKNGFFSFQLNKIKIKHKSGNSVEYKNDTEKKYYSDLRAKSFVTSKMLFFEKHYGKLFMIFYFFIFLFRIFIKNLFLALLNKKDQFYKNKIRIKSILNYFSY